MIELKLILLVGLLLIIMALLDLWKKKMPSIFPTAVILMLFLLKPDRLYLGIAGLIFAFLLYEFGYFEGRADIKVIVIISMMLSTIWEFYVFMSIVAVFGFIYKVGIKYALKIKDKNYEVPFIPLFFIVYVAMIGLMYLG